MSLKKNILFVIFLLSNCFLYPQEELLLKKFRDHKLSEITNEIDSFQGLTKDMIKWRLEFLKEYDIYASKFRYIEDIIKINDQTPKLAKFLYYINYGDYLLYKYPNKNQEAQKKYLKALQIGKENRDSIYICTALRQILNHNRQDYLIENITSKEYLSQYRKFKSDSIENVFYEYYNLILHFQHYKQKKWNPEVQKNLLEFTKTSSHKYLNAIIYQLIASYYDEIEDKKNAIFYENKAITSLSKIPSNYKSTVINSSFISKARYFMHINLDSVYINLKRINKKPNNKFEKGHLKYFYFYKSLADSVRLDYKNAYRNLVKYSIILEHDLVNKNINAFKEFETKYQTAEKEKQILEEQNNNQKLRADKLEEEAKTKQITIALTSTLLLGSIIAFLVYRNTKRKQRIAEQDRELQIQKTETILKEKEIETINAMVSGQEKERLRLAGELHDNIGSTLATVRMQVENLERNLDKVDDPKALLQKANLLINETYEKVRGISHKSNSGVMAKEGLLPAIQKLARTVSTTNQLAIDVQDFGLENRIPNELEITIFRIIQELVTNIVKHAQATEASISLTQHDNELNIMVEDNGKGFKVGKLKEKDGMGLGNIERRVEHLEGTMEVDSAQGRGTSVSIDIPLQ